MLILQEIKEMGYTVYISSRDNKFIFNVAPSNEPKPKGGYPNLRYICFVKGISRTKYMSSIKTRAEEIMGRTLEENLKIAEAKK